MEVEYIYLSSPIPTTHEIALDSPYDPVRELDSISGGVIESLLTLVPA